MASFTTGTGTIVFNGKAGIAVSCERRARGSARVTFSLLRSINMETLMDRYSAEIRYGLRQLRLNPIFTLVAVVSLAPGIGANTAIFQLINANPAALLARRQSPGTGLCRLRPALAPWMALAGTYAPASRASRLQTMDALREE